MWTGDKSPVTNFGAAKEVKNCRLVILLPADLRVEFTAKFKRNGGSHIVANGFQLYAGRDFNNWTSYEELNFKFTTFLSYEVWNPCLRIGDVVRSAFFISVHILPF